MKMWRRAHGEQLMAERVDVTLPNKINELDWLNSPKPLFDAQRLFDAVAKSRWPSHDHLRDATRGPRDGCFRKAVRMLRGAGAGNEAWTPAKICSDRCRQAHRKIALTPKGPEIPDRPTEAKSGFARRLIFLGNLNRKIYLKKPSSTLSG